MNTGTTQEQVSAAGALLAILTQYADLPAAQLELPRFVGDSPFGLVWGVRVSVHDNLSDFERWRERLGFDPAGVEQHQRGAHGWLVVKGTYAGIRVELVGFYDLPRTEGDR
jgi:hypothetical protein